MATSFFNTTHPKNSFDVTVEYDEDLRFVDAVYDDGEDVDITPAIKSHFQSDINVFCDIS